jgi:hypothetical protein
MGKIGTDLYGFFSERSIEHRGFADGNGLEKEEYQINENLKLHP